MAIPGSGSTRPSLGFRPRFPLGTALAGAAAGCILGFLFWLAYERGYFDTWQPRAGPTSGAERILYASDDMVCVLATDGSTQCVIDTFSQPTDWVKATLPAQPSPDPWIGTFYRRPPPGQVVDSAEAGYLWAETAVSTRYVVLADGTVWQWRHGTGGMIPVSPFTMCIGSVLGFVLVPMGAELIRRASSRGAA